MGRKSKNPASPKLLKNLKLKPNISDKISRKLANKKTKEKSVWKKKAIYRFRILTKELIIN
jgi:hypothetical protein